MKNSEKGSTFGPHIQREQSDYKPDVITTAMVNVAAQLYRDAETESGVAFTAGGAGYLLGTAMELAGGVDELLTVAEHYQVPLFERMRALLSLAPLAHRQGSAECHDCQKVMNPGNACSKLLFNGKARIPFTDEYPDDAEVSELNKAHKLLVTPCDDCNVLPGQLHHPGCETEQCPICSRQAMGCDCGVT